MTRTRSAGLTLVATTCLIAAACGGPAATSRPTPTPPSTATTTVNVTLNEWSIATDLATVPAGQVKFIVTNDGPQEIHEFVVMRTDLSLISLPTGTNGVVDEEGAGVENVGEVADEPIGTTQELILELEPGAYVLVCNIYDENTNESHYQMGMRNAFTVTP